MRLATVAAGERLRVAVASMGPGRSSWVDVAAAASVLLGDDGCPTTLKELLRRDGPSLETSRKVVAALEAGPLPAELRVWSIDDAMLAAPVPDPGAFLDFYAFEQHVRSARARRGLDMIEEWYRYPVYYRSNQRAFLGTDATVLFPAGETQPDFEMEVAAVLGAPLHSPSVDEAEAAIAGYCLLNDWSARAIQREVMKVGLGPGRGKDFGTSLGPWLVTPDEIGDLAAVALEARVNGQTWSRGTAGAMNWRWGELIAFAGDGVRFEPGDVFGSGTVGGGCGLEQGRFLSVGDVVELDGGDVFGTLSGTVGQLEVSHDPSRAARPGT